MPPYSTSESAFWGQIASISNSHISVLTELGPDSIRGGARLAGVVGNVASLVGEVATQSSDGDLTAREVAEAVGSVVANMATSAIAISVARGFVMGGVPGAIVGGVLGFATGPAGAALAGWLFDYVMDQLEQPETNSTAGSGVAVQGAGSGHANQSTGRGGGGKQLAGDEPSILDEIEDRNRGVDLNSRAEHFSETNPAMDNNPRNDNDWRLDSGDWRHSDAVERQQELQRQRDLEALAAQNEAEAEADAGAGEGSGKEVGDDLDKPGPKPIVLDLDGNGISVAELSHSTQFVDGGDGLKHRTAWAAAGDGVLFFDVSGDGQINERREYVFTDWDPTATSDLEALRSVFDTNNDGKLTAADGTFASFKVMVTKADGTTVAKTLAQLGITEIDLMGDATRIELPDGSMITGKTTFTRANGSSGTVADMILTAEADGYRMDEAQSADGSGNVTRVFTTYEADGSIAHTMTSVSTPNGSSVTNSYDDNGDGVYDRVQTIARVTAGNGTVTETLQNYTGKDVASGVLEDAKVTTTSSDGKDITIQRDSLGGGWFDQVETRVIAANGSQTITITENSNNGSTIRATSETVSANGLTRTESVDEDGNGSYDKVVSQVITLNANGSRTEVTTTKNGNGSVQSKVTEAIGADGKSRVVSHDRDGNGVNELVEDLDISIAGNGVSTSTLEYRNADGSLRSARVETVSADTRVKTKAEDIDGDGTTDRSTVDQTVINADGSRYQAITVRNENNSIRSMEKTSLAANKIDQQTWDDLNQDGSFGSNELIGSVAHNSTTGVKTQTIMDRNADGSVNSVATAVTDAAGLSTTTTVDADNDGDTDTATTDTTVLNANGSATRTVTESNGNNSVRASTQTVFWADGQSKTTYRDVDGDADSDSMIIDQVSTLTNGTIRQDVKRYAGNETTLQSQTLVDTSADRRVVTTNENVDGDGQWDSVTIDTQNTNGSRTVVNSIYNPNASLASKTTTTVSANGLQTTVSKDVDGNAVTDHQQVSTTVLSTNGTRTTTVQEKNGNASLRSQEQTTVNDDGLEITQRTDTDGDGIYERRVKDITTLKINGSTEQVLSILASNNALLMSEKTEISDDELVTTIRQDRDG